MVRGTSRPRILTQLRLYNTDQPVVWNPDRFGRLKGDVVSMLQQIPQLTTFNSIGDFSVTTSFSEVLNHWYLVDDARAVRRVALAVDANFS